MAKDPDWLKSLKQEAKRLGKSVHELLVEKNIKKTTEKGGPMKAAMGGMVKKKDEVKRAGGVKGVVPKPPMTAPSKVDAGKRPIPIKDPIGSIMRTMRKRGM